MQEFFTQFHFLRPLWLLAIVPTLLLCVLLWKKKSQRSQWQQLIPSDLLEHLLDNTITRSARWQLWGVALGWILACLALSGPTWQKLPQPLHQSQSAVVIVFDLSPSMIAEDMTPSRLVRARYKLTDFLEQRAEGLTALVVYAGEAHVVSPLTDDVDTIINLLTSLSPEMMPLRGSNIEMGIEKSLQLFKDSSIATGKILVVTDNIDSSAIPTIESSLRNTAFELSIIGVGTTDGAPIPVQDGGFAKDRSGNIVIAKLNQSQLKSLSRSLNGIYTPLRADNKDLELINRQTNTSKDDDFSNLANASNEDKKSARQFDDWKDQGHLLALLLLPIIALSFRRGWLLSLACLAVFIPEPSYAFGWNDLWLRSDQQGQKSLRNDDAETASEQFKNPQWRGSAQYRNGDYNAAANTFSQGTTISDLYNHGNALAKSGKLPEAIESYDKALELLNEKSNSDDNGHSTQKAPNKETIEFNRHLVKKILDDKSQQEAQNNNNGESSDPKKQSQPSNNNEKKEEQASDSGSEQKESDKQSENAEPSGENQQAGDQKNPDKENQTANDVGTSQNTTQDATDEQSAQELADQTLAGEDEKTGEEDEKEINASKNQETENKQLAENKNNKGSKENLSSEEKNTDDNQLSQINTQAELNNEQQQALEQWLRQVPDDPSGLLRRKFEYQHRQLRKQYQRGEWTPPENDAAERW
ncbi:MAG: VWA domain-containing protein [Cellvibrionaceae bacterium]